MGQIRFRIKTTSSLTYACSPKFVKVTRKLSEKILRVASGRKSITLENFYQQVFHWKMYEIQLQNL